MLKQVSANNWLDEKVFDVSSFSQNQRQLLVHEVTDRFFAEVVNLARAQGWVTDEHFSVDEAQIEGWATPLRTTPNQKQSIPAVPTS